MIRPASLAKFVPVAALVAVAVLLSFSIYGYQNQNALELDKARLLELNQLAAALHNLRQYRPAVDKLWPDSFILGRISGQAHCAALKKDLQIFNISDDTRDYLRQLPTDPGKMDKEVYYYYLQRNDQGWLLGACLTDRAQKIEVIVN